MQELTFQNKIFLFVIQLKGSVQNLKLKVIIIPDLVASHNLQNSLKIKARKSAQLKIAQYHHACVPTVSK